MQELLTAVACFALGLLLVRLEPRRLSNGVVLLLAVSLAAFGVVGTVADLDSDPAHTASGLLVFGVLLMLFGYAAVLALAGVYYGIEVLRRERFSPATTLALLAGLALLGYLALGVSIVFGGGSSRAVVWLLLSMLPVGYLGFAFTAFLAYSWFYGVLARRAPARDAVVVLGAGLAGEKVTPLLAGRLSKGQQVLDRSRAAGNSPVIVTSGGQGPGERVAEGRAMARWLVAHGTAEGDVLVEDRSRTTRENLVCSREVLAEAGIEGPVTVVTSSYHAFRAATLMRTLAVPGEAVGAPTARYFWPSAMVREFIALLRDHLRLNVVLFGLALAPMVLLALAQLVLS